MKYSLQRWLLAINFAFLSACHSIDIESPQIAAAKDNPDTSRTVIVYLIASRGTGFVPIYSDRVVNAEPVTTGIVTSAKARTTVQGINTIIIGDTCEALSQAYTELNECTEVDSVQYQFGDIEATATTDSEGFVALKVGSGSYRISLQSWVTSEDQTCSWSGSEILPESSVSLELPMLVFCQ